MNDLANRLGRLQPVELRNIWTSESGDFTPWLAREENLALLGDTIGIELELEAQEKDVGPFRADILCKDLASGDWVLIENQLERTDHTHLGQLMTYAAGLKAVTIVWVASRFTEEHRAALDWLNEITNERFNFFGLEIELWQIGNSPAAPKFNIVCSPNDWTKSVGPGPVITDTNLLQQEFWSGLRDVLLQRKSVVKSKKPLPQAWMNSAVGRANFGMHATIKKQKKELQVGMSCYPPNAKEHYRLLLEDREAIEREVGETLDWEELPHRKESRIAIRKFNVDPTDRRDWPAQHAWIADQLEAFHRAFAPRVKELDASDYAPPDED